MLLQPKLIYLNDVPPPVLYRCFDLECHAYVFAAGEIWISTLDTCRRHEGEYRGDPGEGTRRYNTGLIRGDGDNSAFQKIARRIGVRAAPGVRNVTLSNNTAFSQIRDAWVLCCTERHAADGLTGIGRYCVKIERPKEYFERLTETFSSHEKIREAKFGRVFYTDRSYHSLEPEPGPLGFVKPRDIYFEQSEVRMLWISASLQPLAPILVECHGLQELCTRIS